MYIIFDHKVIKTSQNMIPPKFALENHLFTAHGWKVIHRSRSTLKCLHLTFMETYKSHFDGTSFKQPSLNNILQNLLRTGCYVSLGHNFKQYSGRMDWNICWESSELLHALLWDNVTVLLCSSWWPLVSSHSWCAI